MEERSRIRFNPATREIEIEGSEEFVRIYFGKVQKLLLAPVGGKEKKTETPKGPSGGEAEKDEEKNRPEEGPEGNPHGLGRQAHPRQQRGNHDGGAKGKDWARRESDLEHRLPGRETGKNQKDKTGDLHAYAAMTKDEAQRHLKVINSIRTFYVAVRIQCSENRARSFTITPST